MTQPNTLIDNSNIETFRENWDLDAVSLDEEQTIYKLIDAMAQELEEVDIQIEEAYSNIFVSSAQGYFLGKLGELVGIEPKTVDTNEELRVRIKLAYAGKSSNGTVRDLSTIAASIFDVKRESIVVDTPDPSNGGGSVDVRVSSQHITDNPLSQSELESGLNKAVPAGHSLNLGVI